MMNRQVRNRQVISRQDSGKNLDTVRWALRVFGNNRVLFVATVAFVVFGAGIGAWVAFLKSIQENSLFTSVATFGSAVIGVIILRLVYAIVSALLALGRVIEIHTIRE